MHKYVFTEYFTHRIILEIIIFFAVSYILFNDTWNMCIYENDLRSNSTSWAVVKIRPEKNSGLYGIWTHDLCDTGAVLY